MDLGAPLNDLFKAEVVLLVLVESHVQGPHFLLVQHILHSASELHNVDSSRTVLVYKGEQML